MTAWLFPVVSMHSFLCICIQHTCQNNFKISITLRCLFPCITLVLLIFSRLNCVWTDHPSTRSSISLSLHLSFSPSIHPLRLSAAGQLRVWVRLGSGRPYNRQGQPCLWCRSLFALCLPVTVGGRTLLFLILALIVQRKDLWASKLNQSN